MSNRTDTIKQAAMVLVDLCDRQLDDDNNIFGQAETPEHRTGAMQTTASRIQRMCDTTDAAWEAAGVASDAELERIEQPIATLAQPPGRPRPPVAN